MDESYETPVSKCFAEHDMAETNLLELVEDDGELCLERLFGCVLPGLFVFQSIASGRNSHRKPTSTQRVDPECQRCGDEREHQSV